MHEDIIGPPDEGEAVKERPIEDDSCLCLPAEQLIAATLNGHLDRLGRMGVRAAGEQGESDQGHYVRLGANVAAG
jgi:hypothetical protein